ncbi:hypothetical protein TNCV_1418281 [Trichonephila clavipes]|nr:hypothetical protein TNCV_1418281 [Trichonephila clavipes]
MIVLRGRLTTQLYGDDILRTVLLPLILKHTSLIFQQDKVRPHTARVAMNCLTARHSLVSQIARSLSNRACLGYVGKATASSREC